MKKLFLIIALAFACIASAQPTCPPGNLNQAAKWKFLFSQCMEDTLFINYATTKQVMYLDQNGVVTTISFAQLLDSLGVEPGGVSSNVQFNNNGTFGGAENLNWNDTLQVLNIGPWRGSDELNIYADTLENSKIYIEGCGSLNGIVVATNHGTLENPQPRTTRGTLGEFTAALWNGTDFVPGRGASYSLFSTQAPWSATANGMGAKIYTVPNNTTQWRQALQIWGDGKISTSDVSSGRDTIAEFWCDGDMVIRTTIPTVMEGDSLMVKDTMGMVRAWIPRQRIALKNDTNSFTGINIGGKIGVDEINVYAGNGENSKIYIEGTGGLNGVIGTRNFGTLTTPLPPQAAFSTLFEFTNSGWNGTSFNSTRRGSIGFVSTEAGAWNSTSNGTGILLRVVPNQSTTPTNAVYVNQNGNVAISSTIGGADSAFKLYVNGTIFGTSTLQTSGNITSGDNFIAASGGSFTWGGSKSRITSNTNGTITLSNNAINGFNLLYFGGTTSAFPAMQRQNNVIRFLAGDTSAYAGVQTGQLSVNSAPNASAALTVTSTTQGFLPPVMTANQGSAIASPATGLLIYVTDTNGTFTSTGWWGYNGAAWEKLNN